MIPNITDKHNKIKYYIKTQFKSRQSKFKINMINVKMLIEHIIN